MKHFLFALAVAFGILPLISSAEDTSPYDGSSFHLESPRREQPRYILPRYFFKPTQMYQAKGYYVFYGYTGVNQRAHRYYYNYPSGFKITANEVVGAEWLPPDYRTTLPSTTKSHHPTASAEKVSAIAQTPTR